MIKNSAVLFRGSKRNQTMLSYSTAKDIITSAKELKKVRSTKQIDINSFMEVRFTICRIKMKKLKILIKNLIFINQKLTVIIKLLNNLTRIS